MTIDLIGWLTVLYAITMLQVAAGTMIGMFSFALIFQAAAAVKLFGIGVTPSHLLLIVFIFAIWKRNYDFSLLREICRPPNPGFWMILLGFYCLLTGMFLPRLFQGVTFVYPIGSTAYEASDSPVPLGPSSGNWTQSVYMLGSTVVFLATSLFLSHRRATRQIAVALLIYSGGILLFGLADLITDAVGAGAALDFIHNGNYTFHLNEAVVGLKRIAGSYSEASAFANATLGALGFTLGLFINGVFPLVAAVLSLAEIGMLILSTSSTGYVGLFFVIVGAYWLALKDLIGGQARYTSFLFVVFTPLVTTCAVLPALMNPSVSSSMNQVAQAVVYDKASSGSAMERQALNDQAIVNVLDTVGMGTGNGSVRTSSFPLAVVANLGIVGCLIYGALLFWVFFGRVTEVEVGLERSVQAAARLGAWGSLAAACISGTLVDLGLPFFVFAAISCSVIRDRPGVPVRRAASQSASASASSIRLSTGRA